MQVLEKNFKFFFSFRLVENFMVNRIVQTVDSYLIWKKSYSKNKIFIREKKSILEKNDENQICRKWNFQSDGSI